jgi:hypothetical protein
MGRLKVMRGDVEALDIPLYARESPPDRPQTLGVAASGTASRRAN